MLKFLLWFNIIFKFLDVATTHYAVSATSIHSEANPCVYFLIEKFGLTNALILIYIIALIIFGLLYHVVKNNLKSGNIKRFRHGIYTFSFLAILHFVIVINNLYHIFQII